MRDGRDHGEQLMATVGPNPQNLRNTAMITPPAVGTDLNPGDDSATDVDPLVCNSEAVVVDDGRVTPGTIGGDTTAWFGASLKIGDSYSLEFANTTGRDGPPETPTVFKGDDGCSPASTLVTSVTTGTDPEGVGGLARVSFVTSGLDPFYRAMLRNQSPGPILYTVAWSDTTLFSPAWSTNGSFDTFYSFENTTISPAYVQPVRFQAVREAR
jgi:hypothetical protein